MIKEITDIPEGSSNEDRPHIVQHKSDLELSKKEQAKADKEAKSKKPKVPPKPKPLVLKAMVKHEFTQAEIAELGRSLGRETQAVSELEGQKQMVVSDYKAKIEMSTTKIESLSNKLGAGCEMREQEVLVLFKPAVRTKFLYSREGVFIRQEEMDQSDFQMPMPLFDKGMTEGKDIPAAILRKINAELELHSAIGL